MSRFYVVGGRLRRSTFRKLEEWQSCDQALLIELNTATGGSKVLIEYVSPPEVCAKDSPTIQFKSATLKDGKLYACTSTEVLIYEVPSFRQLRYISLPCFNDLHHVSSTERGTLLVVVTGLDMVVEVTLDGVIVSEWSVTGDEVWTKFSRSTDYRLVPTTKPHQSHPNHVFELNGEIWVTRFRQRDAICLTRPGVGIDIGGEGPHDGLVLGNRIYFTTVDGNVVVANTETLKVEQTIDLNAFHDDPARTLGWCRGLLPLDEDRIWIGFTRVRPTKFIENVAWIKHGASRHKPSHIALYDLKHARCEQEIELEAHGIGVVFSLLPIPETH